MHLRRLTMPILLALLLGARASAETVIAGLEALERRAVEIRSAAGGRHRIEAYVARSARERARGLMHVEVLPADQGMLFLYPAPQPVRMWMKNTLIPLDMLFIDAAGRIVGIAADTQPLSTAVIASPGPVVAVLELNAGSAAAWGLVPGDRVRY